VAYFTSISRSRDVYGVSGTHTLDHACAAAPTWSSLHWVDGQEPSRELHADASPERVVVAELAEQAVALFTGETCECREPCHRP
jgi:hypothetical protein